MINGLDIDPQNIKFDFEKAWTVFRQDSRIRNFLNVWALKRIQEAHLRLEKFEQPEDFRFVQGQVAEARQLLNLLDKSDATDTLKEVIAFLEIKK